MDDLHGWQPQATQRFNSIVSPFTPPASFRILQTACTQDGAKCTLNHRIGQCHATDGHRRPTPIDADRRIAPNKSLSTGHFQQGSLHAMMASVVIHLAVDPHPSVTIRQIQSQSGVDVGEFQTATRRLPAVIEAVDSLQVEEVTRWLQSLAGVAFVDVVYVQFDLASPAPPQPSADDRRRHASTSTESISTESVTSYSPTVEKSTAVSTHGSRNTNPL